MGQLSPYTPEQVETFGLEERGVRDGDSPTILFDRNGTKAFRRFRCNWAARFDVVRYFLGDVSFYNTGNGFMLSRLLPQSLPGMNQFVAVALAEPMQGFYWEGTDQANAPQPGSYLWTDTTINRFTLADLVIQYERVPFDVLFDDEVTSEMDRYTQYLPGDASAELLQRPGATQVYLTPDGSKPHGFTVPFPTSKTLPIHRFSLHWYRIDGQVFGPNTTLWNRLFDSSNGGAAPWIGAMNATPFFDLPPGTVLLESVHPTYDPSIFGDGRFTWDIEYRFAHKVGGWANSWWFPPITGPGAGIADVQALVGKGPAYADPPNNTRPIGWFAVPDIPDGYGNYNVRDFAGVNGPGLFSI